jgi:hypothetical protein
MQNGTSFKNDFFLYKEKYHILKEMLIIYLQMDDLKRKELKDFALEKKLTFFNFVNQVLRIRRKWYKTKAA